jgi:predicted adenylyl cyclase CyaB
MTPRRNLELKARCPDLARAQSAALALGARPFAHESQVDTYFQVPHGRLKLRQITGQRANLIAYQRPDLTAVRLSQYHLVPIDDASSLHAALAAALGVRGSVSKQREILLWHNIRIHLDRVDQLGSFVEFEAVLAEADDPGLARSRLAILCEKLAVDPADQLATSYADLLNL